MSEVYCEHIFHRLNQKYQSIINQRFKQPFMTSTTAQPTETKATVIGNINVTESKISLLSFGPSFSPSIYSSSKLYKELFTNFQVVADSLRWKHHLNSTTSTSPETTTSTTKNNFLKNCPIQSSHVHFALPVPIIEPKFVTLWTSIEKIFNAHIHSKSDNLSPQQRADLKTLTSKVKTGTLRISTSDKGGEFVIIPCQLDQEITLLHLKDKTIYAKSTKTEFKEYTQSINDTWMKVAGSSNIPNKTEKRFNTTEPSIPILYTLIKTHKLSISTLKSTNPEDFKIRPIISGCGGPSDKVSWILTKILSLLFKYIPSYITNTNDFLNQLNTQNIETDTHDHYCSYDIENLYTNVDNKIFKPLLFIIVI